MEPEVLLTSVGKNIRSLRKSRGINQQTLAQMCGFEKSNMCRIEAGYCNITLKNLLKIAEALETSVSALTKNN